MKKLIAIVLVVAFALSLVACAATETTKPAETTAAVAETTAAAETQEILVWSYYSGNEQKAFEEMTADFNASQQAVQVKVEFIPFADMKKQLSVGIAANKLPDLAIIDNPDHAAYAAMGMFEDITEKIAGWSEKDAYFEGPWKSTILDGKQYGIPLDSNCLALYYNVDMLKAAGVEPPTTWDELKKVAAATSKDGVYGLAIAAPKSEEGTFQFLPWLLSTGASIEKLDSPEAIKAVDYLTQLVAEGSMSKEVIVWGQGEIEKQFAAGKAAMMVNGPWMIPGIKADAPNMNWNVVKVPMDKQYASVLGGENIGIVKGKNVEAAWTYLQYIGSPDVVKNFISKTGYFPSRKDVAQDKIWTEDPIMKVFADQMQYAQPRGPHAKWPEISNAISTALQEALTQTKTPEVAMQDAQKTVESLLK